MSGFLDKKKRIIDYKITDGGLDKMSRGHFKPKYYTFSDASIFYDFDEKSNSDFKISNSLDSYLPFELSRDLDVDLNPDLALDRVINFSDQDKNIIFSSFAQTTKTLSDHLIEKKYLDNKTSKFQKGDNNVISFDYADESDEFDFINKNIIKSYPTIKYFSEDTSNLPYIQNEKRFLHKTRNLILPPLNSNLLKPEKSETNDIPVEFVFKSLEDASLSIGRFEQREDAIVKIVKSLSLNNSMFKLEYILNEDSKKDEDIYLFELHRVLSNNDLEKIAFIKLGEFIDKSNSKQINVFLIGKIILTRDVKDFIDPENYARIYKIDMDYSFVNMFTLVVE